MQTARRAERLRLTSAQFGTASILKRHQAEGKNMAWKKPTVTEIALGAEINSYACADLKR